MSYVTMSDLADLGRRKKPRRYFVPAVTQRTSDEDFTASAKGQEAFGGMAFEAKPVEDAPVASESGPGSFEPSDIDPGLGQLPLAVAQAPASLGMLDTVATALMVGAGVVLVGSWLMSPSKEKTSNPKKPKLWVKGVKTKWHAPAGLFTKGPQAIAAEVLRAHGGKLASSVNSLNFYINRAGSNLSDAARANLLRARMIVQQRGRSKAKSSKRRAAAN